MASDYEFAGGYPPSGLRSRRRTAGDPVTGRRQFLKTLTVGVPSSYLAVARGRSLAAQGPRRRVQIGGRPTRVIDGHAHCVIPVTDVVQGTPLATMGAGSGGSILGPQRL